MIFSSVRLDCAAGAAAPTPADPATPNAKEINNKKYFIRYRCSEIPLLSWPFNLPGPAPVSQQGAAPVWSRGTYSKSEAAHSPPQRLTYLGVIIDARLWRSRVGDRFGAFHRF